MNAWPALTGRIRGLRTKKMNNRRYYSIADITIQVDSDLPIEDTTFDKAVKHFEVAGPGKDVVSVHHHFGLPDMDLADLGQEIYNNPPWAIFRKDDSWIYLGISSSEKGAKPRQISIFNKDYSCGHIYNGSDSFFRLGGHNSLCLFPTDQILIARLLADRGGFFLHSAGVVYNRQGLVFVGHSEAGKSTMVKMLKGKAEILCDDRNILKKQNGSWHVSGSWSHGEVPDVSPGSARLKAIFFLEKADENRIIPVTDKQDSLIRIFACVIRSFIDPEWLDKTLSYVDDVVSNVPCYRLLFDKSGKVIPVIEKIVATQERLD
jgi:hypothetical protein